MKVLLAPLQRIGNLIEDQKQIVSEIHSVLTVDLVKLSTEALKELKAQTVILGDIKTILETQSKKQEQIEKDKKSGKIKMPGIIGGIKGGFAILVMASALVAASGILGYMQPVRPDQIITGIAIGAMMAVLAPTFIKIVEAFRGPSLRDRIIGKFALGTFKGAKTTSKMLGHVGLAIIVMVTSVTMASWIFSLVRPVSYSQLATSFFVGTAMLPLAYSFAAFMRAIRKNRIYTTPKGLKQLSMAVLAMGAMAIGLATVAAVWNYLMPKEFIELPTIAWIVKAGLIMTLFSYSFAMLAKSLQRVSLKGMLFATLALPLIAVSILGAAWIFQLLPDEYKAPSFKWALGAGLAIMAFAIPFAIVGILAQAITPVGLLLGAAGLILIAATMFVVAWIFSALPDLSAISKNFTDAIMYPINSMIDALARFKNEIGIENLLPLAGGLFAIAGGWLALTAAMAGQAAGGLFSSVANLGSTIVDGLTSLFGGKAAKTPFDLLELLTSKKDEIVALAAPFETLGNVFAKISVNTPGVINGMAAIIPFTERGKVNRFERSATAFDKIAIAYEKISKASNSMNVDAINASSKMFEAIAKIAENNGEDAMTVLAEKLMEAVEKLSETVKDLEDTTSGSAGDIKDAVSGAIENFTKKIMGSKEDTESGNGMLDMSVVVAAIQELEARFDRPILVEDSEF